MSEAEKSGESPPPPYTLGFVNPYVQQADKLEMATSNQPQVPPMPPYYSGQAQSPCGGPQVVTMVATRQQEAIVDDKMRQEAESEIGHACCMFTMFGKIFSLYFSLFIF